MGHRALIADPSPALHGTLRKFLEGAGFKVMGVRFFDEAVTEVQESEPDLVFTSFTPGVSDGAKLCAQIKKVAPGCPVVLIYPHDFEHADQASVEAGADASLVAPLHRGNVVSCAKTMIRLRALKEQVERLEADLKRHVSDEDLAGTGGSSDFEFFKKFLLMEVKRSRRYRYPVSFLLVGLDAIAEKTAGLSNDDRTKLMADALHLIAQGVRDIDVAVPFSEGRFLVFLPHTPRDGAVIVAIRARERLAKLQKDKGITSSVGIASFEPSPNAPPVSFGSLMKDATEALRKAQLSGGNKIEGGGRIKRDRISLG